MNIFKRGRKKLEIYLAYLGLAVLPRLPRNMILICARWTGICAFVLARGQRKITMANLNIVYGNRKTAAEKRQLALKAFQSISLVFIDYFWFTRHTQERIGKYVSIDSSVLTYLPLPPAIIVSAHFGNWELASRSFTAHGYSHIAVGAPLSNPEADAILNEFRADGNAEIIPMVGAVRGLLRALRQKRYIAMVLDQNTKPDQGGVFVDFFGLSIPMSPIAALLAARVNVPIVMVFCLMQSGGHYLVYALPPLAANIVEAKDTDTSRLLNQRLALLFQQEIEKYPEQWMWMYKRWKYIKPGSPASAYPFYAKTLK